MKKYELDSLENVSHHNVFAQWTSSAVKSNPGLQWRGRVHSYISEVACFRTGELTSLSGLGLLRRAEMKWTCFYYSRNFVIQVNWTTCSGHAPVVCTGSWHSHYGSSLEFFVCFFFFFSAFYLLMVCLVNLWCNLSYYIIVFLANEWKSSHSTVNTVTG